MPLTISAVAETFPIAGKFIISRGSKTEAHVVMVTVTDGVHTGRGECVPYARYGESVESVLEQVRAGSSRIAANPDRSFLQTLMKAGAARNAVDCALWDFEAKTSGSSVAQMLGNQNPGR